MTVAAPDRASAYRPGYETLAERIAEFIHAEGYRPGDRLPTEAALGEKLGAGRSTVRDALKLLSASGLVRTRRGSGIFVGEPSTALATIELALPVDPAHVLSLFEYRATVEVRTATLAAERISPRELRDLRGALEVTRLSAAGHDPARFLEGDASFHRIIAEATRNPYLATTVATTFRLQHRAVDALIGLPGSMARSAEQHAAITEAIGAGDAPAASAAMQAHLNTVADDYQQAVRRRLAADIG